jgi:hypothetical protein
LDYHIYFWTPSIPFNTLCSIPLFSYSVGDRNDTREFNENSQILKFWFIPGSFLGILRIPEDSTRNWWGRVKTSKCAWPYVSMQENFTISHWAFQHNGLDSPEKKSKFWIRAQTPP